MTIEVRSIRRWAACGAVAFALGSASFVASAQETIRAVMDSPLRMLDPVITTSHVTRNHAYMVFDTLLGMDINDKPAPQMADWTVSNDGLIYRFTLREGLKWHDGTPVTAADCVASLKRWAARDAGGQMLMDNTKSLTAADARTIELTLAKPFGHVLEMIAKPSGIAAFMMPARLASTAPDTALSEMVGSGPFRFVADEFQPGVKAVYAKFADYVPRKEAPSGTGGGKQVLVDRVEFVAMSDAQTAMNALLSGDIDFFEQVPTDLLPLLEGNEEIRHQALNALGYQTMGRMNFLLPPFDNPAIRRAALTAIGQADVLAAMVGNPDYYQTCSEMYGCGTALAEGEGKDDVMASGDQAKAKAMLDAAGYDGTPVTLLQATDVPVLTAQPVVVAEQLRKAGFNVQLLPMDWQSIVARRANQGPVDKGGWNFFITNWIVQEVWNPIVNPMLNGGGREKAWFGWPTDAEIDAMRAEYAAATDPAAQREIARRIHEHAMDTVSYVPLGQFRLVSAWSAGLDGVRPAQVPEFWGVSKRAP
ncbi:ABC transporter substrate-binding protein [Pseudomonas matsuisoli]|uniref:ABC transporter substrate-binding protein n=1 Tax=Pseudomonas matsuisoli TaxID=1515666 RepID=A0A917PI40_9PSED|nr:ABC transporter substrate-binding protein [Pseudomonas matsuisoli]GGJ78895.1 ABC transporter substrate-binding protein [Pseudomonas matsuisoli]